MESRALLAFLLSLGVFIAWGFLLAIINPPPEKPKLGSDVTVVPHQNQPAAGPGGITDLPTPIPLEPQTKALSPIQQASPFAGKRTEVHAENNIMSVLISNQGAVITNVFMKKFRNDDGSKIDLVNHTDGGMLPLTIVSNNPTINNILQNAFYQPSTESLLLEGTEDTGKVTLHLTHESGLEVTREFTFHQDSYMIEVQTNITGQQYASQNLHYMTLWGPGLGGSVSSHTDHFVFSGATTFINQERLETPEESFSKQVEHKGKLEWTAFQNKYFAAALIPNYGIQSAVTLKENNNIYVGLNFQTVQSSASTSHMLYIGTKELLVLETMGHKLMRLMDYGWIGNKFAFLVKPLLKVLLYFHSLTGNYGWAIIFLTIVIKILFFPLTHKSFKSMKGLQKIQPYVKVVQERNKDNRQKMNEELMDLYKKHKVNPLGGCLPMLLQIPVFIALYHALFFSIELRGAPFIGWITDLSVADPYYVTPVMMGATMFLQQKMTPSAGDPMQQKIMMVLPIVFTFLFITFPAGLVIYWTINNILTIAQQYYIYKILKD